MPATPIHRFQNPQTNPFGPAPSSIEPHLHRPKSSSSLPYARPPNPTGMPGGSMSPQMQSQQQHPIMVALSGWPEPVYVAESKEVARRRSRAGTPVMQPLTTGMGDGVDLSMLPPLGNGSKPPASREYENRYREERSPYPVSSTRSTRTSPVSSIPSSPTLHGNSKSHHQSTSHHDSYPHPPLPKGYHDPRYGPNATLHDRALRVVPAWSSSSASHHDTVGVGMRVPAGQRGEGLLVMRAVPDVYPPPGRMLSSAGGVAKEVYPRDPNNAFLWGGGGGAGGAATPMSSGMMSPTRQSEIKDEEAESDR